MKHISWRKSVVVAGLIAAALVMFLVQSGQPRTARAQEEEEAAEREKIAKLKQDQKKLEDRLNEIKKALQAAKNDGDEGKVKKLRDEAEQVLKQADRIARLLPKKEKKEEEGEDGEGPEELERHRLRLQTERLELELRSIRLDIAQRMTGIAEKKTAAAALALSLVGETMEQDDVVPFLQKLLGK
jgi:uncharacterized phage infection (PIP) family protein YhgE